MLISEYESIVDETCVVPEDILRTYAVLGLVGEAGEVASYTLTSEHDAVNAVVRCAVHLGIVAEAVKKYLRGDKSQQDMLQTCEDEMRRLANAANSMSEHAEAARLYGEGSYIPALHPAYVGRDDVKKEIGDVLWYLAALAKAHGTTLEEVAANNRAKLLDRKARGVIKGSGDNR